MEWRRDGNRARGAIATGHGLHVHDVALVLVEMQLLWRLLLE